jgi:hypothetical protein
VNGYATGEGQWLWHSMDARKRKMRVKSMQGTVLFALGVIGALLSVIVGSVGLGIAALAVLVPGVIMLYQVGKSLP